MRKHWWDFQFVFTKIFVSTNFIRQKPLNSANTKTSSQLNVNDHFMHCYGLGSLFQALCQWRAAMSGVWYQYGCLAWQEQYILFPMEKNVLTNVKHFHCVCHAKPLYSNKNMMQPGTARGSYKLGFIHPAPQLFLEPSSYDFILYFTE